MPWPSRGRGRSRVVANIWQSLAEFYREAGDAPRALESYGKTADVLEALSRAEPSNVRYPTQLSGVLIRIGELLATSGQTAEANHQTRRGLDVVRRLADDPNASAGELDRAASYFMNCSPESLRDPHQALLYARRAVELTKGAEPSYLEALLDAQTAAGVSHAEIMDTVRKALALNPPEALRKRLEAKLSKP